MERLSVAKLTLVWEMIDRTGQTQIMMFILLLDWTGLDFTPDYSSTSNWDRNTAIFPVHPPYPVEHFGHGLDSGLTSDFHSTNASQIHVSALSFHCDMHPWLSVVSLFIWISRALKMGYRYRFVTVHYVMLHRIWSEFVLVLFCRWGVDLKFLLGDGTLRSLICDEMAWDGTGGQSLLCSFWTETVAMIW